MAGIPAGFKGKQPGDRERKRVIGNRCVCVCVRAYMLVVVGGDNERNLKLEWMDSQREQQDFRV